MYYIGELLFLYIYFYISVECFIPTLNVQKIDRKLIERKRQDTLDMCRMFTEENDRLKSFKFKGNKIVKLNSLKDPRRVKRDINPINSSLNIVEAQRVEKIVDRLYDDMAERGEIVAYRRRKLSPPVTLQNQTARRFNFAPAMLLPPLPTTTQTMIDVKDDYEISWMKNWKHGIVPYFIDSNTYDTNLSDIIIKAFDYFEKATCIRLQRLRERPTDKESLQNVEWLYITNPSGIRQCVHSNERKSNRGVQMVVFGYDCLSLGDVLHEVMHILGFSHEHTRPDRDQYITVLWDNIKPGYKKYFEIRNDDPLSSLSYDYSSILHYPSRAFSKNGQVTLMVESGVKIGQREGLSDTDIAKVTTIYSHECTKRNKEYLLNTCPSVVKMKKEVSKNVTQKDIENYFKDRIWPYGIVNYKIKDKIEFTTEERENLATVIRHIEKETCIEFRDISVYDNEENDTHATIYTKNNSDNEKTLLDMHLGNEEDLKLNEGETENDEITKKDNIHVNIPVVQITFTNVSNAIKGYKIANSSEKLINSAENLVDFRKNVDSHINTNKKINNNLKNSSKASYTFGSLSKVSKQQRKEIPRKATTADRRHAESTLLLVRSPEPGCRCPAPGRPKGDQVLKINTDCFNSVNDLLHLFVHILGLDHQHNMHDRDSFLHILWDNLSPEIMKEMHNKLPPEAAVGFPYDYQSVMHYPWLQIKNGVTNIMYPITVVNDWIGVHTPSEANMRQIVSCSQLCRWADPKTRYNDGWAMGHWQGLSSTDVNKLNLIYYEQCSLRRQQTEE